jgi:excisionase family DNA binding protein
MASLKDRSMPKEQMNEQQVAAYLHLDVREVTKLASRGRIPCHKAGGRLRFFKGELDHWVESQMHALGKERLSGIEKGVSAHHGFDPALLVVWPTPPGGCMPGTTWSTRSAAGRRCARRR